VKYFLTFLLLFIILKSSDAQIMYRTRYKNAIMFEFFGISPVASVNFEHLPVRWRNSFMSSRIGVGYVPGGGGSKSTFSMPVSITYNQIATNLKQNIYRRVYKRCKSAPSKIATEWMWEAGLGYALVQQSTYYRNYAFGIIGFRQQVIFDIPPRPRVIYLRVNYTPAYLEGNFDKERGGISIGISL
jgi:hypothetical protein